MTERSGAPKQHEPTSELERLLSVNGICSPDKAQEIAETSLRVPDDPIRIAQLKAKLEVYRTRKTEADEYGGLPVSGAAKLCVLSWAMDFGPSSLATAWDVYQKKGWSAKNEGYLPPERHIPAWLDGAIVVVDYLNTGGQNVYDGGLADPNSL